MEFKLHAPFKPTGDQPEAIEKLAQGVKMGLDEQVLLGVTGSGKTFTMASVIEKVQRPTLVLAHNKTLAAQLCAEFKEFFPENAVEYFVSYYDYYQPEAYIPHTDTYIAKDASTNEEIDRLRLSATCALLERRDVIVVSSVSCIYGLGEPEDFEKLMISLRPGMTMERDFLLKRLIEIRYERNDVAFERNRFRVRGDTVELYPAYYRDKAVRVEFFGDEIDAIREFNPVNGQVTRTLQHIAIYPASHYVTTKDKLERAIVEIDKELDEREAQFLAEGKAVEAQRIRQRTRYDIEMLRELGYCTGIENYSRVISGRPVGSPPLTLIDYFPKDFLLFVDESHVTLPQVRAMRALSSTASACPARSTTARSNSTNLSSASTSVSTFRPRPATMKRTARARSSSRSSARRAYSTRRSRCALSKTRSMISSARSTRARRATSACSSPR